MITNWLYDTLLDYNLYLTCFILGFATICIDLLLIPIEIPLLIIKGIINAHKDRL